MKNVGGAAPLSNAPNLTLGRVYCATPQFDEDTFESDGAFGGLGRDLAAGWCNRGHGRLQLGG